MKLNLKSVLTGSAATVALVAASSASASGYYIGLFGGISTMEDDFTVGTTTSGSSTTFTQLKSSKTTTFKSTGTKKSYGSSPTFSYTPTGSGLFSKVSNSNPFTSTINLFHYDRRFTFSGSGSGSFRSTVFGSQNSFDDGWVIGAAIGWNFGNGWRTELEAAYRSHDVDVTAAAVASRTYTTTNYFSKFGTHSGNTGVNFPNCPTKITAVGQTCVYVFPGGTFNAGGTTAYGSPVVSAAGDGDLETWSFMYNVWYDFDFGDSPIRPFIGGGIGFANASLDYDLTASLPSGPLYAGGTASYRGNGEATDWGFAYQVGAGLGYDLGNGMMLSAQYRYFNTGAMDLSLADQIEVNLESHNFLVGLNIPLGGGM